MTTKENVQVPPIKYSTKRPEHSGQTIIDVNVKNPLPAPPAPDPIPVPPLPIQPPVQQEPVLQPLPVQPPVQPNIFPPKRQKRKAQKVKKKTKTIAPAPTLEQTPVNDMPNLKHGQQPSLIEKDNTFNAPLAPPPLPIDVAPPPLLPTPSIVENTPPQFNAPFEPHYQSTTKPLPKTKRDTYANIDQFLSPFPLMSHLEVTCYLLTRTKKLMIFQICHLKLNSKMLKVHHC